MIGVIQGDTRSLDCSPIGVAEFAVSFRQPMQIHRRTSAFEPRSYLV